MNPSQNPNAALLVCAVQKLVPLLDQIVVVGGCATGMLITDPGAAPVRPTVDVDAIVEVASYTEFMSAIFWRPYQVTYFRTRQVNNASGLS